MITTVYAKEDDMTFIMETTPDENGVRLECVGWYFGEPDEKMTKNYTGNLTAEYSR